MTGGNEMRDLTRGSNNLYAVERVQTFLDNVVIESVQDVTRRWHTPESSVKGRLSPRTASPGTFTPTRPLDTGKSQSSPSSRIFWIYENLWSIIYM